MVELVNEAATSGQQSGGDSDDDNTVFSMVLEEMPRSDSGSRWGSVMASSDEEGPGTGMKQVLLCAPLERSSA